MRNASEKSTASRRGAGLLSSGRESSFLLVIINSTLYHNFVLVTIPSHTLSFSPRNQPIHRIILEDLVRWRGGVPPPPPRAGVSSWNTPAPPLRRDFEICGVVYLYVSRRSLSTVSTNS